MALEVLKKLLLEVGHLKPLPGELVLVTKLHKSRLMEAVDEDVLLQRIFSDVEVN